MQALIRIAIGSRLLLAFSLACSVGTARAAGAEQECLAASKQELKSLDGEIANARKAVPKELKGPQVPSGACTIRAIRFGISMGLAKDFESVVAAENLVNCLELRKFYIERACHCVARGKVFDQGEKQIDENLEVYSRIKKLEKTALSAGIKNPAIRTFVRDAGDLRDCIHGGTLNQLTKIESELSAIIPEK